MITNNLSKSISESLNKVVGLLQTDTFGEYSFSEWARIHESIGMNRDFFENNKDVYFDKMLEADFSTNLNSIHKFKFNITEYIIKQQARIYTRATVIETTDDEVYKTWINIQNLKKELLRVNLDYFLHKEAFLQIDATSSADKILFKKVRPDSIIYDYNMQYYMMQIDTVGDYKKFDYVFNREFILAKLEEEAILIGSTNRDMNSIYNKTIAFYKSFSKGWNSMILYATSFEEAYNLILYAAMSGTKKDSSMTRFIGKKKALQRSSVIPIFANSFHVALLNDSVENDITLAILYSFGLAGVPSELISKLIITKAKHKSATNKKTLMKEIQNVLAVVSLQEGETLQSLETGKVTAMLNLATLFDKAINQICKLKGIPEPFSNGGSGNAANIDEKSSNAFNDYDKTEFDEFESRFFSVIENIIGTDVMKFKTINKSNSSKASASEIANAEILLGSNSLTTPIQSLMIIHGLSRTEAEKFFQEIVKFREEYPNLYSGLVGQSDPSKATEGQSNNETKDDEKSNQIKDTNSKDVNNNV